MNSVITLVSDYGSGSIYTAALMGAALKLLPNTKVIEISHQIPTYDLNQTGFLLRSVYDNFPKGTWHLICVDTSINKHKQILVVEENGHFFIGLDNGVFSLLFDYPPDQVFKVLDSQIPANELFPEKNVFLPLVSKYLQLGSLHGLVEPGIIQTEKTGHIPSIENNNSIVKGTIMFVDGFQNAISNVTKDEFERVRAGRTFKLFYLGKHFISRISKNFEDGKEGDDLLIFNENNFLLVAINKGKGAQLLNLKPGSTFFIEFGD